MEDIALVVTFCFGFLIIFAGIGLALYLTKKSNEKLLSNGRYEYKLVESVGDEDHEKLVDNGSEKGWRIFAEAKDDGVWYTVYGREDLGKK